jgi:hypothetical protein
MAQPYKIKGERLPMGGNGLQNCTNYFYNFVVVVFWKAGIKTGNSHSEPGAICQF